MDADDFRHNEQSAVMDKDGSVRIELVGADGSTTILKPEVKLLANEIIDASVMRAATLVEFLKAQVARAKAEGVLYSVHLKATMMKVSDPIIFGKAVEAFFPKTFTKYGKDLDAAGLHARRRARWDPAAARGPVEG